MTRSTHVLSTLDVVQGNIHNLEVLLSNLEDSFVRTRRRIAETRLEVSTASRAVLQYKRLETELLACNAKIAFINEGLTHNRKRINLPISILRMID